MSVETTHLRYPSPPNKHPKKGVSVMFKKNQVQLNSGDPRHQKLLMLHKLRMLCWGVTAFGFTASAGGNLLHAGFERIVPILIALAAPTFLFAAFELIARIPLRDEASFWARWGRVMATTVIAVISAYNSFFHQRDAIFEQTGDVAQAWTLPIAVDMLMIVGSVSLMELDIQIRTLMAYVEGSKIQVNKPAAPKVEKPVSKKEIVVKAWRDNPGLSTRQIAEKLDVSYNYVHSIVSELKKATQEAEPATV